MRFFLRWMRELKLSLGRDMQIFWRMLFVIPRAVWNRYCGTISAPSVKANAAERRKQMRQLKRERQRSHSICESPIECLDPTCNPDLIVASQSSSRAQSPVFHRDIEHTSSLSLSSSSETLPNETPKRAQFSNMMSYRAPEVLSPLAPRKPPQTKALRDAMEIIHMGDRQLQVNYNKDNYEVEYLSPDKIVIRKHDLWKLPFAILMQCNED